MSLDSFTTDNRGKKASRRNKDKRLRSSSTKSEVTPDELKHARLIAARLVDKYGDTYLPIFQEISKRYERRLQTQQQRDADMANVKAVLRESTCSRGSSGSPKASTEQSTGPTTMDDLPLWSALEQRD